MLNLLYDFEDCYTCNCCYLWGYWSKISAFKEKVSTDIKSRLSAIEKATKLPTFYFVAVKSFVNPTTSYQKNKQPFAQSPASPTASLQQKHNLAKKHKLVTENRPTDKHLSQRSFITETCPVFCDLGKNSLDSIHRDTVRNANGQELDPTTCVMVNRYNIYNSASQSTLSLPNPKTLLSIGNPSTKKFYIGIPRGVPTNIADKQLLSELHKTLSGVLLYRIKSNQKLLHTVKIEFWDSDLA